MTFAANWRWVASCWFHSYGSLIRSECSSQNFGFCATKWSVSQQHSLRSLVYFSSIIDSRLCYLRKIEMHEAIQSSDLQISSIYTFRNLLQVFRFCFLLYSFVASGFCSFIEKIFYSRKCQKQTVLMLFSFIFVLQIFFLFSKDFSSFKLFNSSSKETLLYQGWES